MEIKICNVCKKYTLQKTHCQKQTISPKPAKFSLGDKWGKYRREYKNVMENKTNQKLEP